MREFDTGATRDSAEGKLQYAGYLSAKATKAFAEYMRTHQVQADGKKRSADNWKKGMAVDVYMDSMWRHFHDVWSLWEDGKASSDETQEALCALMFNVQGMLHEVVQAVHPFTVTTPNLTSGYPYVWTGPVNGIDMTPKTWTGTLNNWTGPTSVHNSVDSDEDD